mgnify:CR=1 FL=1
MSGNGNALRYWFNNTGSYSCTVTLYKVGFLGDSNVGSFSVSADSSDYETYSNPGSGTFYIKVTSSGGTGSGVSGTLRANQLDL